MAKREFGITIDDKALNKQIQKAIKRNPKETVKAAKECLIDLAAHSAKRAPADTGDLRMNCTSTLNGSTIFENQTPVGGAISPCLTVFGSVGYNLPYALRQHEELDYSHPKGGEAKFLEKPFEERKDEYVKRFKRVVEDSFK